MSGSRLEVDQAAIGLHYRGLGNAGILRPIDKPPQIARQQRREGRVDLVAGRAALLLELKSRYDGDRRLPARVAAVLSNYRGPVAAMSFDARHVRALKEWAPSLARGLVAERRRRKSRIDGFGKRLRQAFVYPRDIARAGPQFIAYSVKDLPSALPLAARRVLKLPLLTWTVRTQEDRERAARYADQMIFEGFRP